MPAFIDFVKNNGNRIFEYEDVHPGLSCNRYGITKVAKAIKIQMNVFFIIQILPTLIFKCKALKENPNQQIKKMLLSYARSVLFLAFCASLSFATICRVSKLMGSTNYCTFRIQHIICTVSCLIESPGR